LISFAYDAVGNVLSLTDPVNNTTTWVYDVLNRVVEENNQLSFTRYFVCDAVGNLTRSPIATAARAVHSLLHKVHDRPSNPPMRQDC
jgi:YD repeat-containing protein